MHANYLCKSQEHNHFARRVDCWFLFLERKKKRPYYALRHILSMCTDHQQSLFHLVITIISASMHIRQCLFKKNRMSSDGDILCTALHWLCVGWCVLHCAWRRFKRSSLPQLNQEIKKEREKKCKSNALAFRYGLQLYAVPLIPFFMYLIFWALYLLALFCLHCVASAPKKIIDLSILRHQQ